MFVFSQDFTVFGGSLSEAYAAKICKVMDLAMKVGAPIIGLNDSGGARIQEGVVSLGGYADIFLRNTLASGVVPQLSVVLGPCAGGAVYSPAITDFTVMVEGTSYMFVTGPNVVKAVTHEDVDAERLGGATTHTLDQRRRAHRGARRGGGARTTRGGSFATCRRTISATRRGSATADPVGSPRRRARLDRPGRSRRSPTTCTTSSAASSTTATSSRSSRVGPRTSSSGSRDSAGEASASSRSSRRCSPAPSTSTRRRRPRGSSGPATASTSRSSRSSTCPGFLPGVDQEHGGIIRHGAKLLFAYCEATVPKLTVITRKAYGGAYDVMSSKHIRGDMNFAWPTAEIAVMGPEGAVNVIYRDQIDAADGPGRGADRLVADYQERFANPYIAASRGLRRRRDPPVGDATAADRRPGVLADKRDTNPPKKHGNIPL